MHDNDNDNGNDYCPEQQRKRLRRLTRRLATHADSKYQNREDVGDEYGTMRRVDRLADRFHS